MRCPSAHPVTRDRPLEAFRVVKFNRPSGDCPFRYTTGSGLMQRYEGHVVVDFSFRRWVRLGQRGDKMKSCMHLSDLPSRTNLFRISWLRQIGECGLTILSTARSIQWLVIATLPRGRVGTLLVMSFGWMLNVRVRPGATSTTTSSRVLLYLMLTSGVPLGVPPGAFARGRGIGP